MSWNLTPFAAIVTSLKSNGLKGFLSDWFARKKPSLAGHGSQAAATAAPKVAAPAKEGRATVQATPAPGPKAITAAKVRILSSPAELQDPEEEMMGDGSLAGARLRERARCKAIITHPAAAKNLEMAKVLAFGTALPREEAIRLLELGASEANRRPTERTGYLNGGGPRALH